MSTEKITLSAQSKAEIDYWLKKFPDNQRQSALLAALHIVQEEHQGFLTEALMQAVADYLNIPAIAVYEVASFYMMYDLKPTGRHKIYLCTNISCMLRGAYDILAHLERKLKIKNGQTTKDGKFTLKEFECLGACIGAPMMQINKDYHENLTPARVDEILTNLA
jgi:NADH-quinone oxidoreductase subunit E